LMIASPDGRGAGQSVLAQVASVDIVPTVLELAGIDSRGEIDGVSLVPMMEDSPSTSGSPQVAWTYAASTNYGMSIRLDNQWKYIYNDTAWLTVEEPELLHPLQPSADETIDLAASAVETAELRRLLRSSYMSEAAGLRIRIENSGSSTFSGSLKGPMIHRAAVKSVDLRPRGNLEFQPRHASFQVPPATSYTLFLIDPRRQWVDLNLTAEGADGALLSFEERIDVSNIQEELVIALTDSGWIRTISGSQPEVYVAISWGGNHRPQEIIETEPNEALLQQLRALGYIQ
jgi:hypothetical protein